MCWHALLVQLLAGLQAEVYCWQVHQEVTDHALVCGSSSSSSMQLGWKPAAAAQWSSSGSAAPPAGAYGSAGAGTGLVTKSAAEVTAADSCVCWSPDECSCGQQACPYIPTQQQVRLSGDALALFGPDVLPSLRLSSHAEQMVPPPVIRYVGLTNNLAERCWVKANVSCLQWHDVASCLARCACLRYAVCCC